MHQRNTTAIHRPRTDWLAIAFLCGLLALLLADFLQVVHRTRPGTDAGHFGDFRHFYFAARALLQHTDLYSSGTGGYLYPPLIAMLYTPIAHLSQRHAAYVALTVSILMDLTAILLAAREFIARLGFAPVARLIFGAALMGAALNFDKIHMELQMFQTNALMFLMFVLALCWLDRRPLLAGVPLGLIFNIKYLSLALLPWLIIRRRWTTAATFVASAIGFSLLPAVFSGWSENLHNLHIAFGGLLHMVGASNGNEQANVEDIAAWFSCSITSTMARMTRFGPSMATAMFCALIIGLLCAALVALLYRREKFPLIAWPAPAQQKSEPWRGLLGLEFSALVVASLCFSPQTNTRHLLLTLLVTIPASVLILAARGVPRWVLAVGMLIILAGYTLPIGNSSISGDKSPALIWLGVGGPCWCLLIGTFTLLSVGLLHLRRLCSGDS